MTNIKKNMAKANGKSQKHGNPHHKPHLKFGKAVLLNMTRRWFYSKANNIVFEQSWWPSTRSSMMGLWSPMPIDHRP